MTALDPDYSRMNLIGLQNHFQHEVERSKVAATKMQAFRRIRAIAQAIKAKKDALQAIS